MGSAACLGSAQLETLGSALQCRRSLTSRQNTCACYFAACRARADAIPHPGPWSERPCGFGHADPLTQLWATHAHMSCLSEPLGRSVLHARGLPYATPMRRYRGGRLPELSPFLRGFTWLGSVACLGSAQLDTLGSALQCRWVLTSRQSTRACYFAACRAWADAIPRPGAWSERRLRFGHADPLSELGATHAHMSGLSEPMGRSVLHARGLPYATPMRRPCDAHATPMRRPCDAYFLQGILLSLFSR